VTPTDLRDQLQSTLSATHTIERELGGGGMSRVFVAEEQRLKRKVVVKVLSPELAQGISAERFEREIQVAASLQQANIVPVLTAGDMHGLPFYTMPYVDGQSLRSRLARGDALSITETVRILGDVARALSYAHEHGVMHRDIKPDNVLLSGGTAVVTDFGIAKALSASRNPDGTGNSATLTQLGTSIGTPAYMSPEQAAGDPDIDQRADIYAFGCMAYELLAGHPPFHGRTPQRILAAHMGEAPQAVSELRVDTPRPLADLVMQCLAKEPSARPQHAQELVRVLDTVTSSGTMPAMPAVLLGGRAMMLRALGVYAAAFAAVALIAKAAIIVLGLPDWVFPGALIVMALGLPAILFTAYVQRVTRRALVTTPTYTPGGSPSVGGTMATLAIKASPVVSWRRTAAGGAWAVGMFIAIVGGYMLLRTLGIGPAGSLLAAGRLNGQDPILIADFDVARGDSALSTALTEALRVQIEQSTAIHVLPASAVSGALQQMRLPANTRLDLPTAKALAQRQGVKAIVSADAAPLGGGFLVTVKLVNASTLDVLASYQKTAGTAADLLPAIDGAERELRGKIGESLKSVRADPPLEQATTSSLEALKDYSEGTRANDIENDFPKAVALLRQAVALDSTFGIAYRKLSIALSNANADVSLQRAALDRAYALRDHMSPREAAIVEGSYFDARPHVDRGKAYAAYLEALRLDPQSVVALGHLETLAMTRRDLADAERFGREAYALQPGPFNVAYIIQPLVSEGNVAESWRWLDTANAHFRTAPGNVYEAAMILADGIQYDSLTRLLALQIASPNAFRRQIAVSLEGAMLAMSGRIADAHRTIDTMEALFGPRARADSVGLLVGDALLRTWYGGDRSEGLALANRLASPAYLDGMSVSDRPYFDLATVYARAGAPAQARALIARYDADVRDTSLVRQDQPARHSALGEVALAEDKPADAIREFRLADVDPADGAPVDCAICLDINLARAYDQQGLSDSAIADYERYLHTPYYGRLNVDPIFLPGTYDRLGVLYEAKGDRVKAAAYDQRFIDLWKNADPELQGKVADVKRRLARLKSTEPPG